MTRSKYLFIPCLAALCCADASAQLPTASSREHAASVATQSPATQEADFKSMFAKHWRVAKEFTLAVADAMPADGYEFKPNQNELSFGRLMTHIGAQNSDSCATATGTTPMPEPAVTDKATAIKYLSETFDKCAMAIDAMPPERLGTEVYRFNGQPVLASEALWYTFTHMAHHRGQAEVYLRVKNITPPAWRF